MRSVLVNFALVAWLFLAGCGGGARDAREVAADFEGTVGAATVERLLRDVDLTRAPLVVSVAGEDDRRFGPDGQQALTDYLDEVLRDLEGDTVTVTQAVTEETPTGTELTTTLRVVHGGRERYVPVVMETTRAGRKTVLTRIRVMLARR